MLLQCPPPSVAPTQSSLPWKKHVFLPCIAPASPSRFVLALLSRISSRLCFLPTLMISAPFPTPTWLCYTQHGHLTPTPSAHRLVVPSLLPTPGISLISPPLSSPSYLPSLAVSPGGSGQQLVTGGEGPAF
ncbi:hypothetical protein E2C01_088397 [Portunus trituberculatus]|uniref:Uncharacterized protein n=1 Tax=Portunus trituberculatus TaxID=210409 RepID=A0A5B7JFV7_PORTR|nr:hypothetical protein [Portunus trituberculatus]